VQIIRENLKTAQSR
jgi:hypothetical protein